MYAAFVIIRPTRHRYSSPLKPNFRQWNISKLRSLWPLPNKEINWKFGWSLGNLFCYDMNATYFTEELGVGEIEFSIPWKFLCPLKVDFLMKTIHCQSMYVKDQGRLLTAISSLISVAFRCHSHNRAQVPNPLLKKVARKLTLAHFWNISAIYGVPKRLKYTRLF